jgi:hypothetical protein
MKQLMLQTDVDDKIITTTSTRPEDVFDENAMVLAVGKNDKTKGYLVKEMVEWEKTPLAGYKAKKIPIGFELITPYYWFGATQKFEHLWEMQHFFDLFVFEDLVNLQGYMDDNNIEWGKGGN